MPDFMQHKSAPVKQICFKHSTFFANFQQKYEGVDLSADVEGAVREGTYTKYLNAHEDAA